MYLIRRANDRGKADYGWLKANYTFSFSHYHDPNHMGFRNLRVINNDLIMPDGGFPTHPHRDMEIITFILEGQIKHVDSIGSEGVIKKGEIQVMSAGTGIAHSEFNPSSSDPTFLYQIWITPDKTGHSPSYGQVSYEERKKPNELTLLVDNKGENGVLKINQDAELYYGSLESNKTMEYSSARGNVWLQVFKGELKVLGEALKEHDGMSITSKDLLTFQTDQATEFLLFDLN